MAVANVANTLACGSNGGGGGMSATCAANTPVVPGVRGYFSQQYFAGLTCTGASSIVASGMGCNMVSAGLYATIMCSSTTAGYFNLWTDDACTAAATPATMPVPTTPVLGVCVPGVSPVPAMLPTCAMGTYTAPTTGLTVSYFGSATCAAPVNVIANFPVNTCGLGADRAPVTAAAPYLMAACGPAGSYTTTSVRPRVGEGGRVRAGSHPPPPAVL